MSDPILQAISDTKLAVSANLNAHWIIGFSGGKDSTALVKIFCSALRGLKELPKKIDIIYCDTGVENIVLDEYIKSLLTRMRREFTNSEYPISIRLLEPPIADRFFVKIIGRGYPPPTNNFRWCTKNLRIKPVSQFIKSALSTDAIVCLGTRLAESEQRNRTIKRAGASIWQSQIEGGLKYQIFAPLINMSVSDVWDAIYMLQAPKSVSPVEIEHIYRDASGECPVIKAPQAAPCSSGRFGCWTCTVVRKDKSARLLIESGYGNLRPFLEFRDWLAEFRNDHSQRWPRRRNGSLGPGPFTLNARKQILDRIDGLEKQSERLIISNDERVEIERLWNLDESAELLSN